MTILSSTTLFSYESINSSKEKLWKMGVDIPLHGSELLALSWVDVQNGGAKLKGNFARRVYMALRNHKNSKENLENLKSFADGFGEIIYLSENLKKNPKLCSKEECRIGRNKLSWSVVDDHLYLDDVSKSGKTMRFDFSNLTSTGPKRLSIYPLDNKINSNSFKVELFFNQCE